MNKTKNKNKFTFETNLTSEEIILAQHGDEETWNRIVSFFFPKARMHAYLVHPGRAAIIQECDLQAAFFTAIDNAVKSFKTGRNRFENYYLTVYKHELSRVLVEHRYIDENPIVSLDSVMPDTDDTLVFADSLAASTSDDKTYLDVDYAMKIYQEALANINDEMALKVADLRRNNKTFQEIAEELGTTPRIAWQKFQKYTAALKEAFHLV